MGRSCALLEAMQGRGLVLAERTMLVEILARRDPGLVGVMDRFGTGAVKGTECDRVRRAVVDELCELPENAGRQALELEELLIHLKDG